MPRDDIDTSKPLHAYGVDSLLAVELRNCFSKELSADVAIFDLTGGASVDAVSLTVAKKSTSFSAASGYEWAGRIILYEWYGGDSVLSIEVGRFLIYVLGCLSCSLMLSG